MTRPDWCGPQTWHDADAAAGSGLGLTLLAQERRDRLVERIARALLAAEQRGAEREREVCAAVADDHAKTWGPAMASPAVVIANAIRGMKA